MNRFTAFVFCVLIAVTTFASAQSTPAAPETPKHCYALNYVLKELDGTKVINQRSFALETFALSPPTAINAPGGGEWTRLRVGNRLPIGTGKDVNYVDVGINIDTRLRETGNTLALEVAAEISSVAAETGGVMAPPTVRQMKANLSSNITPGKPSVIFAADDPSSQHRFELQVTASLVR